MNNAKEQNALLSHFHLIQFQLAELTLHCLSLSLSPKKTIIKFTVFLVKQHKNSSSIKQIFLSNLHNPFDTFFFFAVSHHLQC